MKIPVPIIVLLLTPILTLQTWQIREVHNLSVEVSAIKTLLHMTYGGIEKK